MQRTPFDIPAEMRDLADKSVGQARKAFNDFIHATEDVLAKAEGPVKTPASESTGDLGREALAFLEENVAASFDLAQRLVKARTVEEVAALQQEFFQRQAAAATEQGKTLGEMAGLVARDTAKPAGNPEKK